MFNDHLSDRRGAGDQGSDIRGRVRTWTLLLALAVPLSWAPAVWADDDDAAAYQKLERQLRKEYDGGNYEAALSTAEKMRAMRPDNADTIYNIACCHSLMGQKEKAYEWLGKAVDAGYRDADHMQRDADFRRLWGEDRFRKLVKRAEGGTEEKKGRGAAPEKESNDAPARKSEEVDEADVTPQQRGARIQALTEQVIAAAEEKDYKKALELAQRAHEQAEALKRPEALALTKYNVARMYALSGEKEKALEFLEASVKAGSFAPDMARQIEQDGDLKRLRDDPRYKEILSKARRAGAAERVEPQTKVTTPKGYVRGKKTPLLVVLHPWGGGMEETSRRWQPVADAVGAILLTPQGTHRLKDGEYRWDQDIDLVEQNVLEAVESVMDQYEVDDDRVIIAGFSQGGWAAYGLAVRNPELFTGLIAIGGNFDSDLEKEADGEDLVELKVAILYGEDEEPNLRASNIAAEKFFKKLKAGVKAKEFKGQGHEYPKDSEKELTQAVEWIWE